VSRRVRGFKRVSEFRYRTASELDAMLPGQQISVHVGSLWVRFCKLNSGKWSMRSRIPASSADLAEWPSALVARRESLRQSETEAEAA
jgi:hypothetical protein